MIQVEVETHWTCPKHGTRQVRQTADRKYRDGRIMSPVYCSAHQDGPTGPSHTCDFYTGGLDALFLYHLHFEVVPYGPPFDPLDQTKWWYDKQ